jgi:hypothetical protein
LPIQLPISLALSAACLQAVFADRRASKSPGIADLFAELFGSHQCRFAFPISVFCSPHFSFSLAKPLISIAAARL